MEPKMVLILTAPKIKNQVADLSIDIASKVLEQELDTNKNHQEYIDKLLKEKKFD